ncbi:uncharacterized protein LOC113093856 [Carassius auratus]|uniref:Uncharacterized protein LOC113093856 n=1 Tax=Carassius auratus TaxID=7957 RepID=A0A6P6P2A0_CARAU|nr:uncharacterized protein LOC113093856 [Carassius auratus]
MQNLTNMDKLVEAIELAEATQHREVGQRVPPFPRKVVQEQRMPEGTQRPVSRPVVPGPQDEPMPTEAPRSLGQPWLAGCTENVLWAEVKVNGRLFLALLDSGIAPPAKAKTKLPITCVHGDTREVPGTHSHLQVPIHLAGAVHHHQKGRPPYVSCAATRQKEGGSALPRQSSEALGRYRSRPTPARLPWLLIWIPNSQPPKSRSCNIWSDSFQMCSPPSLGGPTSWSMTTTHHRAPSSGSDPTMSRRLDDIPSRKSPTTGKSGFKSSILFLLDLPTTFDMVKLQILLSTLLAKDMSGTTLQWFESYLSDKSFEVTFESTMLYQLGYRNTTLVIAYSSSSSSSVL